MQRSNPPREGADHATSSPSEHRWRGQPDNQYQVQGQLEATLNSYGVRAQPAATTSGGTLVAEVTDTHHPHRSGRVLAKWVDGEGDEQEHWLVREASVHPEVGDRVMITRPANWNEWIVVGILAKSERRSPSEDRAAVRLEAGTSVRVESATGEPLFELTHRDHGAVVKLHDDFNRELEGTFRVDADRIEMRSRQGGTDTRTDGEMILRSPCIRIN
ncbi:MAG: hypothetical protein AAGA56_24080 [Myxococcota bacterium]